MKNYSKFCSNNSITKSQFFSYKSISSTKNSNNFGSLIKTEDDEAYVWGVNREKDIEQFRKNAYIVIDDIYDHLKTTNSKTVLPKCKPNFLKPLLKQKSFPDSPQSFNTVMNEVNSKILKNFTLFPHKGYLSWFPCHTSYPGMLGHLIDHGFENPSRSWDLNPSIFELEKKITDWFKKAYNLPNNFSKKESGAVIYHGVSLSSISSTLAAKRKKIKELNITNHETIPKLRYYCSEQAHYSIRKAANIAGSSSVLIPVKFCKQRNNFVMNTEILRAKIEEDVKNGNIPVYICSTIGTTGTTAIDETKKINQIAKEFGMWHHVDAAYAGNSAILPEYSWVLDGVEGSNSFAFNPVKMFPMMQNSACCYYENIHDAVNAYEESNDLSEEQGKWNLNYLEFGNVRLNKALKLYSVLTSFGLDKLRDLATKKFSAARVVEDIISKDSRFELYFNPCKFGLVCFKLKNRGNDDLIKFMNAVNADGNIFIGPFNVEVDGVDLTLLRISINYLYIDNEGMKENMEKIMSYYDKVFDSETN